LFDTFDMNAEAQASMSAPTASKEPVSSDRPNLTVQIGQIVAGKYRVDRVIGEGGMGFVVEAMHTGLGDRVALKFLKPAALQQPDVVARFAQEARAAAKLKSEHVCRVIDVGEREDGSPFIVMEHLQGRDLASVIEDRSRLDIPEAVEYVIQACEGLAEAHARGIVHRDVKPENLFLVERDDIRSIKILDFGISKSALSDQSPVSGVKTQNIMGSPCYMSPEQLRSTKTVDHRADIWSLGAVLFELLTGHTPYDHSNKSLTEIIALILEEPPRKLAQFRKDVPPELEAVILRCLMKDKDQRMQNAAELAIALLPFASRRSRVSAERATKFTSRSRISDREIVMPSSSHPPPGLTSSSSQLRIPPLPAISRPDHVTPLDLSQTTSSHTVKRRWTAWVVGAVALVASAGGVVAMGRHKEEIRPVPPVPVDNTPVSAAAPAPAPQPELHATVHVVSTPPGASVTEDGAEVCATTPCDVEYKGEAAGPAHAHALVLTKAGFKPETKQVHAGDQVSVKLGAAIPAPRSPAARAKPEDVPQGFKDLPY
jgi:serine/threonine-protein kinase